MTATHEPTRDAVAVVLCAACGTSVRANWQGITACSCGHVYSREGDTITYLGDIDARLPRPHEETTK
jgi:hypothetical protein